MKTNVWCCDDIFRYAKVSAIVELCLSGIMNIVLLLGLIIATNSGTGILQLGIFNFILISTNTILVSLELNSFCGKSMESCDKNNLDSGCRIDRHLVFDSTDFMCNHKYLFNMVWYWMV